MTDAKRVQALKAYLFAEQQGAVFTILDGASVPDLLRNLAVFHPDYACLYRGELAPDLADVAPYLAIVEKNSCFTDWILANGWGRNWGVLGAAEADLATLKRHFRQFLIVYDGNGKSVYFRFYDPRVMAAYLPTCGLDDVKAFFGPVRHYYLQLEDSENYGRFHFSGDSLEEEELELR